MQSIVGTTITRGGNKRQDEGRIHFMTSTTFGLEVVVEGIQQVAHHSMEMLFRPTVSSPLEGTILLSSRNTSGKEANIQPIKWENTTTLSMRATKYVRTHGVPYTL